MPPAHHSINYVELTVADVAEAKRFYGAAFGWGFVDYGPDYASFTGAGLDGGMAKTGTTGATPGASPLVVLYSSDLEETQRSVERAGGRIVTPIFAFPGGRRFHFADPSGNELAVWSE